MLTIEDVVKATNDAELTVEELTEVLKFSKALVTREKLRGAIAKTRALQSGTHNQFEVTIQDLQQKFDAVDAGIAAQS